MNKKQWIIKLCTLAVLLAVVIVVAALHENIYGPDNPFVSVEDRNPVVDRIVGLVPAVITAACAIIVGYLAVQLIGLIVTLLLPHISNKAKTVLTLSRSLIKWIIIVAVIVVALQAFGVDTFTILAGLGILALAIGLGAQQIVSDVLAGFFIVFEAEFKVGDIITLDGWRGTVTDIGVRVTKITDAAGNVKIVNNSDIKSVVNLTAELSVAFLTVSIDYAEDLHKVELVLRDNLAAIKANIPAIVDGPYYKGVTALGSSSVDLLLIATCKEADIYQVKRDINREIFLLFGRHNITIPFNQITVSQRDVAPTPYLEGAPEKAPAPHAKAAKQFLDEQIESSKDIDEENK